VSYAYHDPHRSSHIFDVTQGSNGGCGTVLCNAGPGWDGPTGLGTPDRVAALASGPQGIIAGKVTKAPGGAPIRGATVTATGGPPAGPPAPTRRPPPPRVPPPGPCRWAATA